MTTHFNHPFHLVTPSPWPLVMSISLLNLAINTTMMMWNHPNSTLMSILTTSMCFYQWMRDINRESFLQGMHNKMVIKGLKAGMILFIISEILLFMSLFWMFFHLSLSPSIPLGNMWPPTNINQFDPMMIPLLNTSLLLSSGFSITWSHYSILSNKKNESLKSMALTIILGMMFIILQAIEYKSSQFTISDSSYGSSFFMITGFHGMHVIVGCIFLVTAFTRLYLSQISCNHHFNFEAASWYWHFVDIVWLFVFTFIYF